MTRAAQRFRIRARRSATLAQMKPSRADVVRPRAGASTVRRAATAVLAAAAALAACAGTAVAAQPTARTAVVSGTPAAPGQFPWMVGMNIGCGATLIAPDRVLTAAHCVEGVGEDGQPGVRADRLRVFVGARLRAPGALRYDGRSVQVADIASHPLSRSVSGARTYDAAILRLAEPVSGVPVVPLAGAASAARSGVRGDVVGWGVTRSVGQGTLTRALRVGALRVLGDRTCERVYGRPSQRGGVFRRATMLCTVAARRRAARRATSPCSGDSGGPLISRGVQVGIVSFGINCDGAREPTVFAEVAGLRAFIDDPAPTYAPQPLGAPTVEGRAAPGEVVTCRAPAFRNPVSRIVVRWGIGRRLVAVTGGSFRVPDAARGRRIACRVLAENRGGDVATDVSPYVPVGG